MALLSERFLREALPMLDLLPEPALWIDKGSEVLWFNECARHLYKPDSSCCFPSFHGLDRPCNELGEPCPKGQAESLGAPVSVIHAHLDRALEPKKCQPIPDRVQRSEAVPAKPSARDRLSGES